MVQQLERSRPPGRNDPCFCGSGKKYKKCCLARQVQPVRRLADVIAEVTAAEELGDREAALQLLEEARGRVRDRDLDSMLIERYLDLASDEAEMRLRVWWEREHNRYSGTGLATLLLARNERTAAYEVLQESHGNDAPPQYWRMLSTLRDEQGDTTGAVSAMELYARLAPEDPAIWIALADMQLRAGQHERALVSLRRAGDLVPERLSPRMLRLRQLAAMARWRETRDLAEALLEGRYDDATEEMHFELRDILADAYHALGDFGAARSLLRHLAEQRPDHADICFRLAQLELLTGRHRRALQALDRFPEPEGQRELEARLHCLLALQEYDEAAKLARLLEEQHGARSLSALVRAAESVAEREYSWALEHLTGTAPAGFSDMWYNLRLTCLAHLGRWPEIIPALRTIKTVDEQVVVAAAVGALAAGKFDVAERLVETLEDQRSSEAHSIMSLLGPLRQIRRAAEVRRQHRVDEAEMQRRTLENRELRRRVKELEHHNAALAEALARSEETRERLLEMTGMTADDEVPADWEHQWRQRAHRDALEQELRQAEQRLRSMLGDRCWQRLSESARISLREGEWLYVHLKDENRDHGAALLEYARGLERAYKDAIFRPLRQCWDRQPGPVDRLQDEGHDPSLGPLVRYLLQGNHLTLGSMAAALERMADARRQGVAISLLRQQLHIADHDEHTLDEWRRTAERLASAADSRNRPAHAGSVSRDAVRIFRDLVLGSDGLLAALDR